MEKLRLWFEKLPVSQYNLIKKHERWNLDVSDKF